MCARRTSRWIWLLIVLPFLVVTSPAGRVFAEEETPENEESDEVELEPVAKEQAKVLSEALKKAAKKKKAHEVMPALEAIDGLRDESFEKPLLKMLVHKDGTVAVRAAEMLEERRNEKLLKKMWKCLGNKLNNRRYAVRAVIYRAHGRAGEPLSKKKYDEIHRDWRAMIGNPQERFAGPLTVITEYALLTKDKRMARSLAEELDEPGTENANSPANPPAEWWERRWKMWQPMKAPAAEALAAITGEEFESTETAKEWIRKHKKDGFEW